MLTFITFSMMSNKFHLGQSIQSISRPVISGKILHVLTLESKKWDVVAKKPTGETVVNYTYVTISKGTGHRHDIEEGDAVLIS